MIVDCGVLSPAVVEEAKALQARRANARTYFVPNGEDRRWTGYAAELWFGHALQRSPIEHRWLRETPFGNPDFVIEGMAYDAKAINRGSRPRANYESWVAEEQCHKAHVETFLFFVVQFPELRLWCVGELPRLDLLEVGLLKEKGEALRGGMVVQHSMRIVANQLLDEPTWWPRLWKEDR